MANSNNNNNNNNNNYKKTQLRRAYYFGSILIAIISCGNMNQNKPINPNKMPPPPLFKNNNNQDYNLVIPNSQESITKESQNINNPPKTESRITEKKGAGGSVTEVQVKNKWKIPSYYLYPASQSNPDRSNIQAPSQELIVPNWRINW